MKRNYLILSLIILACSVHGQTAVVDTVNYRFTYDVQMKLEEDDQQLAQDEHWLDVGIDGVSKYYSHWKEQRSEVRDSIIKNGGNYQDVQREYQVQGLELSLFDYYVYKNLPKQDMQTVIIETAEHLKYEEPMGQNWDLQQGDTIILNHPCNKAQTSYHGRTWTVWYAVDIPIADGPWKLCGLPGLIMAATDSHREFIFRCIGVSNNINTPLTMRRDKVVKTNPERAHRTLEMISTDFDNYLMSKYGGTGKTFVIEKNGRKTEVQPRKCVFIETY